MSTYGIAGSSPFGPFTKTINALVRDLVYAQYNAADPAKEDPDVSADRKDMGKVRIGTGWENNVSKPYEIHCIIPQGMGPRRIQAVLGWHRVEWEQDVHVHVFARRNDLTEPAQAKTMRDQVERIIGQYPNGLAQGGPILMSQGFMPSHDPKDYTPAGYWHYVAIVLVKYWTVSTL